jgi:outer membrane protein OmpA-like peptidoglycan-associated protein
VTIFAGLTYEFRRGGQKAHPMPADRDEDGVYDDEDKCPDEPGEEEDDPDRDGCPQHAGATATQDANSPEALAQRLQDGILVAFEPGSVEPTPSVKELIAQLAPIILQHPEWPGVLVAGYSDGTGAPDEQFKVSAARAEAVRLLLIAGKLPEDRLWADGFGTAAPRRRKGEFYSRGFVKIRIATTTEGGSK